VTPASAPTTGVLRKRSLTDPYAFPLRPRTTTSISAIKRERIHRRVRDRDSWDLERSVLYGRRFRDLEDMRAQVRLWRAAVVDQRHQPKMRRQRRCRNSEA
jgi:hypothetical protein